jgi:hypothetical protein
MFGFEPFKRGIAHWIGFRFGAMRRIPALHAGLQLPRRHGVDVAGGKSNRGSGAVLSGADEAESFAFFLEARAARLFPGESPATPKTAACMMRAAKGANVPSG